MMMKKNLFSLPFYENYTSFPLRGAIRSCYIILLFLSSFFCAQESTNNKAHSTATITVSGGGMIYSIDETFNNSVLAKKVLISGESAVLQGDEKKLAVKSEKIKKIQSQSFSSEVKIALKKKEQIKIVTLQKLKNKLNNNDILKYTAKSNPYSHTIGRGKIDVSSCITSSDSFRFTGWPLLLKLNPIRGSLDYLYDNNYKVADYPLTDFNFSKIFSVRPPPLLYFS